MNGPDILSDLRAQLTCQVGSSSHTTPDPLPTSPWVAMSLLQKSIRRGEEGYALQAAATLLHSAPDRLWRRLGGIAFEDIGLADVETISLVTAALGGKRLRASMGGEWSVAHYLVTRMAQARKNRAADDLLMIAELHPVYERDRLKLTYGTLTELMRIATGVDEMPRRATALWYALGTDRRPSPHLRPRRGNHHAVFDYLCDVGYPHTLVEVSREGFRRTAEMLAPLTSLLVPAHQVAPRSIADDDLPPTTMCGPVPSWALDKYSREGTSALRRFLRTDAPTARWVRRSIRRDTQLEFLAGLVFRVEGGLLRQRERWPRAEQLRHIFEVECNGSGIADATELLDMMRDDISVLNGVRADVL